MGHNKSLDLPKQIIASLVVDVQTLHGEVFTPRSCQLTVNKLVSRLDREGMCFLTKALPRLGKALDRALTGEVLLDSTSVDFESMSNSKLPKFFGELFQLVFNHDGSVLPTPCVRSINTLRQVLYLFYKYELPYDTEQEQQVLEKFVKTDRELGSVSGMLSKVAEHLENTVSPYGNTHGLDGLAQPACAINAAYGRITPSFASHVIREARSLLFEALSTFDIKDILPRHGPGAVSTKETLWEKYTWTNVPDRITKTYPLDEYYFVNMSHVCDRLDELNAIKSEESSAEVILVPKDSRGPRLISCEPLEFQWIQQGLGRALMDHVERTPITKGRINFTDQRPNQELALSGSATGEYATLDLNEASDRVSVGLVQLLFPEPVKSALLNCRSLYTTLPDGTKLKLNKFAPMGSALCFPVLALSCWALVTAGMSDASAKHRTLVYGDDVIVKTTQVANAIAALETFGLKVNRDKSCTSGFFRESCGMDAYKGTPVTPVRLRTVWTERRSPESYASWIAYANSFYHKKYFNLYDTIVRSLVQLYGEIPSVEMGLPVPSLEEVPEKYRPKRSRSHADYQKRQWRVWALKPRKVHKEIDGWPMLMRWYAEFGRNRPSKDPDTSCRCDFVDNGIMPDLRVRSYTKRRDIKLLRCWR